MKAAFLLLLSIQLHAQTWHSDLDKAFSAAGESGKDVMLLFSVPESCDICQTFESKVLQSDAFKTFAQRYVLAHPEFGLSGSAAGKPETLLIVEKYNKDGFFPWVVIIDSKGNKRGQAGMYDGQNADEYIRLIQAAIQD